MKSWPKMSEKIKTKMNLEKRREQLEIKSAVSVKGVYSCCH